MEGRLQKGNGIERDQNTKSSFFIFFTQVSIICFLAFILTLPVFKSLSPLQFNTKLTYLKIIIGIVQLLWIKCFSIVRLAIRSKSWIIQTTLLFILNCLFPCCITSKSELWSHSSQSQSKCWYFDFIGCRCETGRSHFVSTFSSWSGRRLEGTRAKSKVK